MRIAMKALAAAGFMMSGLGQVAVVLLVKRFNCYKTLAANWRP